MIQAVRLSTVSTLRGIAPSPRTSGVTHRPCATRGVGGRSSGGVIRLPVKSRPGPQRSRTAVSAGKDDEADAGGDDASSFPQSTESLFMQELRKRGVSADGTPGPPSSSAFKSGRAGADPFGSSGGGIPGTGPLNNATVGNDPLMTEDQLEKSRKLNSEGLEGLIPRATELLKLGGSQFLAFLPFMGVGVVLFVGCYFVLGSSFIHGGTTASGPPPYVDPYLLLDEPTYDPTIPLQ